MYLHKKEKRMSELAKRHGSDWAGALKQRMLAIIGDEIREVFFKIWLKALRDVPGNHDAKEILRKAVWTAATSTNQRTK